MGHAANDLGSFSPFVSFSNLKPVCPRQSRSPTLFRTSMKEKVHTVRRQTVEPT